MYEIIKNAPPMGPRSRYPFADMEVWDAFDAPDDRGVDAWGGSIRQSTINSCARAWAKRRSPGAKFTIRKQPGGIIRCQRIA